MLLLRLIWERILLSLSYLEDKHTIMLALTSNEGAFDFQTRKLEGEDQLYKKVLEVSKGWNNSET